MKRELGIARCGLACCLCSENATCNGCNAGECPDRTWCENRRCSIKKGLLGCWACEEDCKKGLLRKIKPSGFTQFVRQYGTEALLDCLERNERAGVVYHRAGVEGDYDATGSVDALFSLLLTGKPDGNLSEKS